MENETVRISVPRVPWLRRNGSRARVSSAKTFWEPAGKGEDTVVLRGELKKFLSLLEIATLAVDWGDLAGAEIHLGTAKKKLKVLEQGNDFDVGEEKIARTQLGKVEANYGQALDQARAAE